MLVHLMLVKSPPVTVTRFKAWSCDFIIELIESDLNPVVVEAEIKAQLLADEQRFSRFLPNSTLSQLNQGQTIRPCPRFKHVYQQAKTLAENLQHGGFNPHVNLAGQGYAQSIEKLPNLSAQPKTAPAPLPFPDGVIETAHTLSLKPHTCLDFGSFLKGLVAAEIADRYAPHCRGLIVNFGGDIAVRGQDRQQAAFPLSIYNPVTKADHPLTLQHESLCTSGTYKRQWHHHGKPQHHLTNPHTHRPANTEWVSISFWGPDGALCDALATTAFNATPAQWQQWTNTFNGLQFLAVHQTGTVVSSLSELT